MTAKAHYLAFETGGTKLIAGIAGPDRRLLQTAVIKRAPEDRAAQSFQNVVEAAESLMNSFREPDVVFQSIGFGFGGTVRRSTNQPHLCLHEDGWSELDVVSELDSRFHLPVFVENDCKLAALAESQFGAGEGAESVFYVTLGTGVGGGFVRKGWIQAFGDYGEAEIGHIVVEPEGLPCCCGGRGCVETLCSGPGLSQLCSKLAEEHAGKWGASVLSTLSASSNPPSETIISAWEQEDEFAGSVIEYSIKHLAVALAATINLLVPERVVIGGGIGTSSPQLLDLLRKNTEPLVVPYFRNSYSIETSKLQESVVTQGAAILAAQHSS